MGLSRPGDKIHSSVLLLLFSFNYFSFLFIFLLAYRVDLKDETDSKNVAFSSLDRFASFIFLEKHYVSKGPITWLYLLSGMKNYVYWMCRPSEVGQDSTASCFLWTKGRELTAVWVNVCYFRREPDAQLGGFPRRPLESGGRRAWPRLSSSGIRQSWVWLSHFVGVWLSCLTNPFEDQFPRL